MGGKRKRGANKASVAGGQPTQKRPKTDDSIAIGSNSKSLDLDKSPFADENNVENRKREANIYELLGSPDSDERLAAADALVTGLLAGSEPALKRHLEKRLFRGLASSRNASRLGFSLVLAEVLRQLFGSPNLANTKFLGLTFDKVLSVLVDATKSGANLPGQEERDFFFGRLFGLQCFVEAKILFDDETRWPQVLDLLLEMAQKKVWIRSHCGWVIVESLPQMGQAGAEAALQKLSDLGLAKTAEGVGIWLRARSCYPNMQMPQKHWVDPLSPAVLPEVARVLKENVANDTGGDATVAKIKQSNWTAQMHFVWDLILAAFLELNTTDKKQTKDQFRLFWTTVIDDGLFSKSASDGQKFRGFMLFQKYLQGFASVNKSLVKELFTRNFMKCLINQAAKEDRYLHRAAFKCLQSMEKAIEASPELLLPILKELIGKFGSYDFDQRTSSRTIENLLQWATPDNAKTILKLLREPILQLKDAPNDVERFRQAYADYVFKMTTQAKATLTDDADGKGALEIGIKELASCAYSSQEEFVPDLSEKSRDIFRKRLSSAFSKIAKQSNHAKYLCDAVKSVKPTAVEMSDEIEAERKTALKAMAKLLKSHNNSEHASTNPFLGLALLYAATLVQLYDGAPDAISILQDLQACTDKIKSKEAGTSELLVEILLALVSRQSPMLRQISEQVFETFTSHMSPEALGLLMEPLLAEENSRGYQALFENLDDEDAEIDDAVASNSGSDSENIDEDEVSEIGSDVEFVTLDGVDITANGDEDEEHHKDDEAEGSDDESVSEDPELAALDDALAKVLNSHRLDQDKDADSSDDGSDMTDSEMMALDEKLVDVFKQRVKNTNRKNEKKDAKMSVVTFKHRILDYLSIYVKQEASNPLACSLLLPLLELVRTTSAKPLANKAMGILTDFAKASKKIRSKETQFNTEAQLKILIDIHEEASKDSSHAFAKAASTASLLIASNLWAADKENVDRINAAYAETFAKCQKGKIKMQGIFFSDWVNWGMGHANNTNTGE
ncbi:hypothetical protein F5Y19DRAFT_422692 [Xylariaceae sp. FL1651]|nr:hypothetical protein F5Y19DRAFT_422692 [Xylariaceae sp. FL1651]